RFPDRARPPRAIPARPPPDAARSAPARHRPLATVAHRRVPPPAPPSSNAVAPSSSLYYRLVDDRLVALSQAIRIGRRALRHPDRYHLSIGGDPENRPGRAVPPVLPPLIHPT